MTSDSTDSAAQISAGDVAVIEQQLGRPVRGRARVAYRCPCGNPAVLETAPRLPDGSPFPTTFYLTCPRLNGLLGGLEGGGVMNTMTQRLADDEDLAAAHLRAHESYLAHRETLGDVPEIAGYSAGGMPDRVKCLHALAAHSLAAGPGINPLGDEALAAVGQWWRQGPCVAAPDVVAGASSE